jgi:hypothetical protein
MQPTDPQIPTGGVNSPTTNEEKPNTETQVPVDPDTQKDDKFLSKQERFKTEITRRQLQSSTDQKYAELETHTKFLRDNLSKAESYEDKFKIQEQLHQLELELLKQGDNNDSSRLDLFNKINNEWDEKLMNGKFGDFIQSVILDAADENQARGIIDFVDKLFDLMIDDLKEGDDLKTEDKKSVPLDGPEGKASVTQSGIDPTKFHMLPNDDAKKQSKAEFANALTALFAKGR